MRTRINCCRDEVNRLTCIQTSVDEGLLPAASAPANLTEDLAAHRECLRRLWDLRMLEFGPGAYTATAIE